MKLPLLWSRLRTSRTHVCLDRWCYYDRELSEPSRETGIPRLAVVETDLTPGASGTIANNHFRPHKTMLVRTVAEGGQSYYFCGPHRATFPALRRSVVSEGRR